MKFKINQVARQSHFDRCTTGFLNGENPRTSLHSLFRSAHWRWSSDTAYALCNGGTNGQVTSALLSAGVLSFMAEGDSNPLVVGHVTPVVV